MMIKARDLKVGQWIMTPAGWDTVVGVSEYETGVMVSLGSQIGNPFISCSYASYNLNAEVQVDGYPE